LLGKLVPRIWAQQRVEHARDVAVRSNVVGLGARLVAARIQSMDAAHQAFLVTCGVDTLVLCDKGPCLVLPFGKR